MRQRLTDIAYRELDIPTLETRERDSLDFHEVSVWSLADALADAYKAGRASAKKCRKATLAKPLRTLIDRACDLIAAIEGVTDQFEPEVARLRMAVTKAERLLKGGAQ